MVTQGVKGIAITPTSPAVIPALNDAVAKGVKVVLIDNDLPTWSKKSSVVSTDNLKGGRLAGAYIAQHLKKGGTLAVLQGVPGVPALDDRVKGMEQALGSSGIKVVAMAPTDCDQNKGVTAAADLLSAHPDVAGIYGACGPPTLGAIQSIQKAHRANVIMVSPNILMLAINTIQTVMKDARMREQADLIRKEVGTLLNDVRLISDRVGKLQSHLGQADDDIESILISTGKVASRAERIERVELREPAAEAAPGIDQNARRALKAAESVPSSR